MKENHILLNIINLKKYFPVYSKGVLRRKIGSVRAVDDISFSINKGETLGLVGESGCGKSTTGRTILQLLTPTSGHVFFKDVDLTVLDKKTMRRMRQKMQLIFQDPYSSLNPRITVGEIVSEPLIIQGILTKKDVGSEVENLLEIVGLNPSYANRYPHEFSGGQRQRIGIARSLALKPEFIVCDEPISALDVSIQAQIINLLEDLQQRLGLTYLFIAHDLSMVKHISSRIAVMYLGSIVEITDPIELYKNPLHPYSQALLSAVPIPDPIIEQNRKRIILKGDVPSPVNPPSGCSFRTRCPLAKDVCSTSKPKLREISPNHFVSCHLI